MTEPVDAGELFLLFVVVLGYVPALRAYLVERDSGWLVAGFTALLVGRVASVAEGLAAPAALNVVEHAVGVALAGALFAAHFHAEWRADESRYRSDRTDPSPLDGD